LVTGERRLSGKKEQKRKSLREKREGWRSSSVVNARKRRNTLKTKGKEANLPIRRTTLKSGKLSAKV